MTRTAAVIVAAAAIGGCAYPRFEFGPSLDADTLDAEGDSSSAPDTAISDAVPMDDGTAADAMTACEAGLSSCAGRCVDVSTDFENCSACNARCANGQKCASSRCVSMPSCAAIHAAFASLPSAVYTLDPDGDGPLPAFSTYCEMVDDEGGWTLALKLDGSKPTFAYASALWTNDSVLNAASTDLSAAEAKLASFSTVPFTRIRAGMIDGGVRRYASFAIAAPSLRALFAGAPRNTGEGRAKWLSLLADPMLQPNCNVEGINQEYTRTKMRFGIVGNNEPDCGTPDSYIGFGVTFTAPSCFATPPDVVVGNAASIDCLGVTKDKASRTFGYLFVR